MKNTFNVFCLFFFGNKVMSYFSNFNLINVLFSLSFLYIYNFLHLINTEEKNDV